jgi:PadR family transcriptional regulator PadR
MISKELIKGTLRFIVLKLLSDTDKMYGYEITQKVSEITGNKIKLTFAALYPVLHKMEADGLVRTKSVNVNNRIRKYYSLTAKGGLAAGEKIAEFQEFMTIMNGIFND